MASTENLEANRLLSSILRILVESYEQTAAHSSLMIRDSDLRAGERYLANLTPETKRDPFYMELILGTVLAIGLQAVIDNLPPGWLSDVYRFGIIVGALMLAVGILISRWWFYWRRRMSYQDLLSNTLRSISEAYSSHSALSVRLQRDKQLRVALEALMLPLGEKTWEEIARARYLPEVRGNIDRIAEIDRQRMLDKQEYDSRGGDFWLEMLQATLRSQLPAFICTYLESAKQSKDAKLRSRNLNKWRKEAKNLCEAMFWVDKRFSGYTKERQKLLEALDNTTDFNEANLSQLLAECKREPFNYAGSRAKPPSEFYSQAGFVPK